LASRWRGRALAEEHLARGWDVLATVRDPASLDDIAQERLEPHALDITDWPGVDALRRRLDGRRVDTLFVNAAIVDDKRPIGGVEADVFTQLMVMNALAPLRLVERFVDLVPAGGMVAVMSSSLGSIALNDRAGWELYRIILATFCMRRGTLRLPIPLPATGLNFHRPTAKSSPQSPGLTPRPVRSALRPILSSTLTAIKAERRRSSRISHLVDILACLCCCGGA
jgi:hypothetical protein